MTSPITDAVDTCNRFFLSIDLRRWDDFEATLAPEVLTDFTGLWGGDPETTTATGLREGWEQLFAGFTATQHLVTNYISVGQGDTTVLQAAFRAVHFGDDPFGSPSWTLYGTYRITLAAEPNGYRITALHQSPTRGEGNRNIVRLAAGA